MEKRAAYPASHVFGCFPLWMGWLPCHPGSVPFGSPSRPLRCGISSSAYCCQEVLGSPSRSLPAGRVQNARIDGFIDNKVLLSSWEDQLSRSLAISDVLKSLFQFTYARKLHLSLVYVPSKENPADGLSRVVADLDCTLSPVAWQRVDSAFGPHTLGLMTIPCNVKSDRSGRRLRFFSPFPCPFFIAVPDLCLRKF